MKTTHKLITAAGMFILALFFLRYFFIIGAVIGALLIGLVVGYFIGKRS